MGILNVTPDSFSDGGRFAHSESGAVNLDAVLASAQTMIDDGVDVIDVGGESTRPGAQAVPADIELARVVPVIEALARLDVTISVDTSKASVAAAALEAGAHLVNDVTGAADPDMLPLVAAHPEAPGLVLMHMQGEPRSMQNEPRYDDVVAEVAGFLQAQAAAARAAGIDAQQLMLDPGIGFGKTLDHNVKLLQNLDQMTSKGIPLLVGASRKRMIGDLTGRSVSGRLAGSLSIALHVATYAQAVPVMVRVHDVRETVDAFKVWQALHSVQ
ncbi:MAG: dihydropteroate synthase [Pseudomonadaceae bacterium]|nr:dihydropteroate synthase [Pseudomonadaceae bacterium]